MSLRLPVFMASSMYPLACSMPSLATSSVMWVVPSLSACLMMRAFVQSRIKPSGARSSLAWASAVQL